MKLKLVVLINIIIHVNSFSQVSNQTINPTIKEQVYNASKFPYYISFDENKTLETQEINNWFLSKLATKTQLNLIKINEEEDILGMLHTTYQEYYERFPIENAIYKVHSKNGKILSMNGNLIDEIEPLDTTTINSIASSKAQLISVLGTTNDYKIHTTRNQRLVLIQDTLNHIHLAYKIKIEFSNPYALYDYFIDANNGQIIKKTPLIHTVFKEGIAKTVYSGEQKIITDSTSTGYILRDPTRGNGIETYNLKKGKDKTKTFDFIDSDNIWDTTNTDLDQYALDAHWGAETTYDYYLEKHQRNSIDGLGYKLKNLVHYDQNFANAYWDGSQMVFGDGNASIGPLVSLDIIGHEITHGLTANTAKLLLENESGALNESFSDIFGVTIDWYKRSTKANWTVGEEVSSVYRSLENPKLNKDPNTYNGQYWKPMGDLDFGGVHSNNGVQNYWYYLLCNGGNGTNDLGNSYSVKGIGIEKASQIAFRNLSVYLISTSNYRDARFFAIKAAEDLFGKCSKEVEATINAWYAVGVGSPYLPKVKSNFSTSSSKSCENLNVQFQNLSLNASSYKWIFSDGDSSLNVDPTHLFNQPGKYNVALIAFGDSDCGANDTTYQSIQIDNLKTPKSIVEDICSNHLKINLASDNSISGYVKWFNGNLNYIDTGNTIDVSNFDSTQKIYYEDGFHRVGPTNVTSNIGNYSPNVRYQVFDVYSPILLKSFLVNASVGGDRIIELRNSIGQLIKSDTIFIPQGINRVNIDLAIDPGNDYRLGIGGNLVNLGRSNAGIKYPYTIPNIVSIKRSNADNAGLTYYYFFYDWEIQEKKCLNGKNEITWKVISDSISSKILFNDNYLTVTDTAASVVWYNCDSAKLIVNQYNNRFYPTQSGNYAAIQTTSKCHLKDTSDCFNIQIAALETFQWNYFEVSPNPTTDYVNIKSPNTNKYSLQIKDMLGRIIASQNDLIGNQMIDLENNSSSIYFLEINQEEKSYKYKIVSETNCHK